MNLIKKLAGTISLIFSLPFWLAFSATSIVCGRERIFPSFSQLLCILPGITGQFLRRSFYRLTLSQCSPDCCICFGALFSHTGAQIGRRVYIGPNSMIGSVKIENDVLIGSNVSIINGNQQHGISRLDIPIRDQPGTYPNITVGKDSWIGDRSIVMANIGKHCVIGAGSVVTKNIPDYSIAFGNPARVIRDRRELTSDSSNKS